MWDSFLPHVGYKNPHGTHKKLIWEMSAQMCQVITIWVLYLVVWWVVSSLEKMLKKVIPKGMGCGEGCSPDVLNLKICFIVSSVSGVWVDSGANLDF